MSETKLLVLGLVEEEMAARRLAVPTRVMLRTSVKNFLWWASQRGTPEVVSVNIDATKVECSLTCFGATVFGPFTNRFGWF